MKIGIIAEENNDVDVVKEMISKFIKPNSFSVSRFVGHGCGKLRRKCSTWATHLSTKGCQLLIVVHDVDRASKQKLEKDIQEKIKGAAFKGKLVLLPKEELEAWLLSDANAIRECFSINSHMKIGSHPEVIKSPKEFLRDMIFKSSGKRYVNTVHNIKIAKQIDAKSLLKCNSFTPLPEFLRKHFGQILVS